MRVAQIGRALNAPTVVHIGPVLYWHSFVIPYNCALILASTITVKHRRFIHPSIRAPRVAVALRNLACGISTPLSFLCDRVWGRGGVLAHPSGDAVYSGAIALI